MEVTKILFNSTERGRALSQIDKADRQTDRQTDRQDGLACRYMIQTGSMLTGSRQTDRQTEQGSLLNPFVSRQEIMRDNERAISQRKH